MIIQFIRSSDRLVMAEGEVEYLAVFEDDIYATLAQLQGTAGQDFYPKVRMGPSEGPRSELYIQIEIDTGENDERCCGN